jgi:hypothetical protein
MDANKPTTSATAIESHAQYMARKLSEAQEAAKAKRTVAEARRTAAKTERAVASAERAAQLAAGKKMLAQRWERLETLALLPADKRAKQLLKQESELHGVQALWGNLLNWTDGKCQAAWTSRYQQAIRLKAAKLTVDEINEASEVVKELIERFISDSGKYHKLCVVLLELKQHLSRILQERSAPGKAKIALQSAVKKGVKIDKDFEDSLKIAIENARNSTGGYVYLKQWSLADGTRWFKVGITNNPNRRDAEQNVLPVPAVTLRLMETQSMDQAAAIERALHQQLAAQKVTGAGNRELFHLDEPQLAALMAAMDS